MARDPRSILLIKPSALGDVVQSVGVARLIKRQWPQAQLGWLVNDAFAGLVEPLAFVDRVHRFPRGKLRGWNGLKRAREVLMALTCELRSEDYELVLDLQGLLRSGLLTWASGGTRKVGLAEGREGSTFFYTEKVPSLEGENHAIDRYLNAARSIGVEVPAQPDMSLGIRTAQREALRERWSLLQQPFVLVVPGARWLSKRWPPTNYSHLIRELAKRQYASIVLAGSPDERDLCDSIREEANVGALNTAGQTTVSELAALSAMAQLVVCNDSAAMHMAALNGTPLIALFGPTNPALTGPWRRGDCVLRAADAGGEHSQYRHTDDRMMRGIRVERVLEQARKSLD